MDLTEQQRIDLARQAEELRAHPVIVEAIERMRRSVYERMRSCSLRDADGLAILHQQLKVIDLFAGTMEGFIQDGKLAQREWDTARAARRDGVIGRTIRRVV